MASSSTLDTATLAISFDDVAAAARRLHGIAHRTPVVTSRTLDARLGAHVFLKCENLQRMGAFKFRGAYNALARFTPEQRARGVVAYSSGNHAQAIALSARLLGMPAAIVMPHDAPAAKMTATRAYGAEVIAYDRYTEDREAIGRTLAHDRGMTLVPPYDHPDVMAGQGTAALELFEDTRVGDGPDHGPLDALLVCVGGGGLIAGCATVAKHLAPASRVIGVEPEAGNDAQQSKARGERVKIDVPRTIADGVQTQQVGALTFPILQTRVDEIVTVSDAALIDAMRFAAERLKLVIEPTGALGLAALMSGAVDLRGQRVGVIVSGGNVDLARFAALIGAP